MIFSIFLSFNAISATEVDLSDNIYKTQLNSVDDEIIEISSSDTNLIGDESPIAGSEVNQENSRVIYVGQNTAEDGGNGSYENPFSSLQSACDNVSGEDKVTVNIFNGTYEIGSVLSFNTNDLFINGLGNVIIKNEKDANKATQAFSLSSASSNFTMSNIIFDASGWSKMMSTKQYFTPFVGNANYGTYINCTFTGFKSSKLYGSQEFNSNFTNCTFEGFKDSVMFVNKMANNKFIYFENCIFIDNTINRLSNFVDDSLVSVNGAWFGNTVPKYFNTISNMKYAIFSVNYTHLDKNQFEIIGKLCWNGTNDVVGDSFAPMTVALSSSTGEIASTATLENGIFRTIYNSTSIGNNIKVTLYGNPTIDLNFNIDNITIINEIINALNSNIESQAQQIESLNATVISQNSTIESLNATVNNQASTIESQNGQIESLNATVNNQASTIESQNGQIESLNATVNNQASTIESQKAEIDGLNGTVNSQAEQINDLNKQINKKNTTFVVDTSFTRVAVDYSAGERGGMFYATLKDSDGNVLVNKTVQIALNGNIYNVTTDDGGRAGLQVNLANAGTYTFAVSFQGDDEYNAAPMASSKLTVTKKKTSIKASNKVFNAKTKSKKISVTLKTVKNQYDKKTYLKSGKKVTLKVNGKTYTAKINKKGVAKFTIKINKKGKYTAKIKFAGDKTYKASSKTIKIRIK